MIVALLLAAAPQIVGVLEFRDKVPPEQRVDAAYLSDQVRAAVKESLPQARVITRENMLVLLQASGKKLEECEGQCEVETGRLLGADLVVSGELLRFGSEYKLNMKLHDTRSGELLAGAVASGATANELDRNLRPAVRKLLGVGAPPPQATLPGSDVAVWAAAGYAWASSTGSALASPPTSGFAVDLGGHLFFRVAGPVYLGGLIDYGVTGPNGLLVAPGVRVAVGDAAISAAFGWSNLELWGGGLGAMAAADYALPAGLTLRVEGTWRHATASGLGVLGGTATETVMSIWSLMGGLALHL